MNSGPKRGRSKCGRQSPSCIGDTAITGMRVPVTKKSPPLNVAGIVVAAALIDGIRIARRIPQVGLVVNHVDQIGREIS